MDVCLSHPCTLQHVIGCVISRRYLEGSNLLMFGNLAFDVLFRMQMAPLYFLSAKLCGTVVLSNMIFLHVRDCPAMTIAVDLGRKATKQNMYMTNFMHVFGISNSASYMQRDQIKPHRY